MTMEDAAAEARKTDVARIKSSLVGWAKARPRAHLSPLNGAAPCPRGADMRKGR